MGLCGALYFLTGHSISLSFDLFAPLMFILALILGGVAHEIIHALGWIVFGKVPREAIEFGFNWKGLMPYTHCKTPVKASAYRIGALLPGAITGLLPAVAGLIAGSLWLTMVGAVMIGAAGGDVLILWVLRAVPSDARILDHPTKVGCEVVVE